MLVHALSFPKMAIAFPVIAVQAVSDSVSSPFFNKKISNATSLHLYLYYNGPIKVILGPPRKRPPLRASNHYAPKKMHTRIRLY